MRKSLAVNAILNTIRQTLAIVFPLITFPYASRVLGNVEYGRYSFSASIISYFILLSTFGINNYAVREGARIRDDKNKIEKFVSDLFSIGLMTTVVSLILMFSLTVVSNRIGEYRGLIAIQSLSMVFNAVGVDWVNTIYEDYFYITIRYIAIQLIALVAVFIFIHGPEDTAKYCCILVAGSYGGNLVNLFYIRRYVKFKIDLKKVKWGNYIFPLLLLFVNSLATVIYVNSDITMLGFFASDQQVGVYSFASKIYNMVKYMINAVLVVTVPRLAYILGSNGDNYKKYLESVFNILILILAPCVTGICLLSKTIIMFIGGEQYISGNSSLRILSFSLVFALIASIFSNCVLIINRLEKRCLIGTITSATVNVTLNFALIPSIGITGASITTVIAEFINMLFQRYYAYRDLKIRLRLNRWVLLTAFLETVVVATACILTGVFFPNFDLKDSLFRLMSSIVVSIISYVGIIYLLRNKLRGAVNLELFKK